MNSATTQAKLTAAQFDLLIDAVRDCRASLAGCASPREAVKEAAHLRRAALELVNAVLARKNNLLEERRLTWLSAATAELIRHTTTSVNDTFDAAELGRVAGERFATARAKMNARIGRIALAQCAGRSHQIAWDAGKVQAADVVRYCEAFLAAAFALLEPKGLVTL